MVYGALAPPCMPGAENHCVGDRHIENRTATDGGRFSWLVLRRDASVVRFKGLRAPTYQLLQFIRRRILF